MPVVLLVSVAGANLALTGDGPGLGTELRQRPGAPEIRSASELGEQELPERSVLGLKTVGEHESAVPSALQRNPPRRDAFVHELGPPRPPVAAVEDESATVHPCVTAS